MTNLTNVAITHLATTSKEARDQILEALHAITEYGRVSEPGLLKYAICLPDTAPPNPQDETSIYVLEEFTDMTAINQHMSSPLVTELHVTFKESNPPLLQPTTNIWTISWLTDALLSRNDRLPSQLPKTTTHDLRARIENPYIIFAIITDPDPRDIDALEPFGAAVVKYATESEPDTIFYADALPKIVADGSQAETEGLKTVEGGYICAWEVYASKQACLAHLQDESVKNLAIEGHKLGSKFTITPLIMKEGWLIRE